MLCQRLGASTFFSRSLVLCSSAAIRSVVAGVVCPNTALPPSNETIAHIPIPIPIRLGTDFMSSSSSSDLVIRLLPCLSHLDIVVATHAIVRNLRPLPAHSSLTNTSIPTSLS